MSIVRFRAVLGIALMASLSLLSLCQASKLRSWRGPTNFVQGTAPSKRYGHGFAEIEGEFYVFGGFSTGQLLFYHNTHQPSEFTLRYFSTLFLYHNVHHSTVSSGDWPPILAGRCVNDLFVFGPSRMMWTDLSDATSGTPPSPRYNHGFKAAGGKLFVFGGKDGTGSHPSPYPISCLPVASPHPPHTKKRGSFASYLYFPI